VRLKPKIKSIALARLLAVAPWLTNAKIAKATDKC
jgi:hypothetical protein